MIRLPATADPELAHGLDVLVDLARLLPAAEPGDAVVRIDLSPGGEAEEPECPGSGVACVSERAVRRLARRAAAVEEQESRARDAQGRVPSTENPFVQEGTCARPVLQGLAASLRRAAFRAAEERPLWTLSPWPHGARWAVALTHDVDVVTGWPALTALRALELARGGHVHLATSVIRAGAASLRAHPVHRTVRHLLRTEERASARGTWFFLAGRPTLQTMRARDVTYKLESRAARRLLAEVWDAGAEVGLHGSFRTSEDGVLLRAQKERLEAALGDPVSGVRQHFLRMRLPETWRDMRAAGFAYDSTLGFPDRAGFRLGVADVVPLWDGERAERAGIDEIPFAWMDRSASKYEGVEDPRVWVEAALQSTIPVRDAEGCWVGIWHPYLADALGFVGAPEAFEELVRRLAAERPWFATLSEIVQWRRARRVLKGVLSGGDAPRLAGSIPPGTTLENATGARRPAEPA